MRPVFVGSAFVAQYPTGGGNFWVPLQYLLGLVTQLGAWSYAIIFAAAALECAAFAGLIVPGESLVLASGFLAHRGLLPFARIPGTKVMLFPRDRIEKLVASWVENGGRRRS